MGIVTLMIVENDGERVLPIPRSIIIGHVNCHFCFVLFYFVIIYHGSGLVLLYYRPALFLRSTRSYTVICVYVYDVEMDNKI